MIHLTEHQTEVYKQAWNYLSGESEDRYHLIYGFAGTGKTTVVTRLLNDYMKGTGVAVALTAPVNKAVKVLKKTLKIEFKVSYSTIHSLLGLRPVLDRKTGEIEFKRDYTVTPSVMEKDIVVVDEASMLNDELFRYLVELDHLKILFVGDHKQLRPIGKENSRNKKLAAPFRKDIRDEYKIGVSGLRQIIRQDSGSGIIPLSARFRKQQYGRALVYEYVNKYEDLRIARSVDTILPLFDSEAYKEDPDTCKILAYTNKVVREMNRRVREHIYGKASERKIVVGERLIVNSPIIDPEDHSIRFTTNDELEVKDFKISELMYQGEAFKVYVCTVDDGSLISILHEEAEPKYAEYVEAMTVIATSQSKVGNGGRYWAARKTFMEAFADITYSYAITCHKSQGSTYRDTLMVYEDINGCWDKGDRPYLFYTGLTRASNSVTFLM